MIFQFVRSPLRALIIGVTALSMATSSQPAVAASQVAVDFTVHETLSVTTGSMISSDIPGCATATVATIGPTVSTSGKYTSFTGTKVINCGSGNTINVRFRARTLRCEATDMGTWKVTRGTGTFAGAKGQGELVGAYTLGRGAGTFCEYDGINDHYTGKMKL